MVNEDELENLISSNISVLNSDWMVIGRQVRTAGGIIDLLCIDGSGDLIVVELKKALTPREVTAQEIDYASCVADLHIEDIAKIYLGYTNDSENLSTAYKSKYGIELDVYLNNKQLVAIM